MTVQEITTWLKEITANPAEDIAIFWFNKTKHSPLSIIGGWCGGFSEEYKDLLYLSEEDPTYALCVKIVLNQGPYAYTDFELMDMSTNDEGDIEDTLIAIQRDDDDLEALAKFLFGEWQRLTQLYSTINN